jgi:cbb3-type cytochrome oxidase subunit 3
MWLLILEALAALGLLILLVWWVMFSGRPKGERNDKGPGSS